MVAAPGVVLLLAILAVPPSAGRTLVSYAYYMPREVKAGEGWKRCARNNKVCGCAADVRFGNPLTKQWVVRGATHSTLDDSSAAVAHNCTAQSFEGSEGIEGIRECHCKGNGGRQAQYTQCRRNLLFFLDRGVAPSEDVDYVFHMIGGTDPPKELEALATTHDNVKIRSAPPSPIDLCVQGSTAREAKGNYSRVFFINCSARGPYHSEAKGSTSWLDVFEDARAAANAHLVGPVINCWQRKVHVQSWTWYADEAGVDLIASHCTCTPPVKRNPMIQECEIGVSQRILESGGNIASLQESYSGFDWKETRHQKCNGGYSPIACSTTDPKDGLGCKGANPCHEVFVKYGGNNLPLGLIPVKTWERVTALDAGGGECPSE